MSCYEIVPYGNPSLVNSAIVASDASEVLGLMQHLDCKNADVLRDGVYSYSIQKADNGLWSIYQRQEEALGDIPVYN